MKVFRDVNDPEIVRILSSGGVAVIRTDTLYGIVGQAKNEATVSRIYTIKRRDETKSAIVLVSSLNQLFDAPHSSERRVLEEVWPGKVSVILQATDAPSWIQRDNHSVAYRLPDDQRLQSLLTTTGPLIAPSTNPEGAPPAMTVEQAYDYFGDSIDAYVDGGMVEDEEPSKLLRVTPNGTVERLR